MTDQYSTPTLMIAAKRLALRVGVRFTPPKLGNPGIVWWMRNWHGLPCGGQASPAPGRTRSGSWPGSLSVGAGGQASETDRDFLEGLPVPITA